MDLQLPARDGAGGAGPDEGARDGAGGVTGAGAGVGAGAGEEVGAGDDCRKLVSSGCLMWLKDGS